MEPESLDVFLYVLDDITAYLGDNFLLWQIESMQINLKGLDVFAECDDSS